MTLPGDRSVTISRTARRLHFLITVKGDLCLPNKTQIAHEILAYLAEHPDAQDTLDGIVQWWLLERKIKYQKVLVKEVLDELISEKLIKEYPFEGSRSRYQINRQKIEEARRLLCNEKE